ncbi:hypothetical protein CONPUDRAFT_83319, partial [Coniophora puteana RWD-64-598 SS2]
RSGGKAEVCRPLLDGGQGLKNFGAGVKRAFSPLAALSTTSVGSQTPYSMHSLSALTTHGTNTVVTGKNSGHNSPRVQLLNAHQAV